MTEGSPAHANRPGGSRIKQQTLPAWKPIFTANCVVPIFFVFGIIFIPIGVVLLLESNKIKEMSLDYTSCTTPANQSCSLLRENRTEQVMRDACVCNVDFTLSEDWPGTVYVYYRLTEFYQNHRRYLKSVNQEQLQGETAQTSGCIPNAFQSSDSLPIMPCGMIANSRFNDSYTLFRSGNDTSPIDWRRDGIAWTEDTNYKFGNPTSFAGSAQPVYWQENVSSLPGMMLNEDLAVWMRTAALPKFRKLYARITDGLTTGNYTMSIEYNYPIRRGHKTFVLSTTRWIGGKNSFLGIAYLTVGGLSIAGGCALLLIHAIYGKRKRDVSKMH
ncbi:cell cycle control protein 50A-like [Sycon ciliatum]|uniref:cell cycle control protein 50A-like n=1 Tax=Sycon ciliatum TaxID=27933 RepID=UPI0020AB8A8B|eukprot:scpid17220/ scgid18236/ Cell cycle control protein 50A; Transmembrane protein 30A